MDPKSRGTGQGGERTIVLLFFAEMVRWISVSYYPTDRAGVNAGIISGKQASWLRTRSESSEVRRGCSSGANSRPMCSEISASHSAPRHLCGAPVAPPPPAEMDPGNCQSTERGEDRHGRVR